MEKQPFITSRLFVPSEWVKSGVRDLELTVRPLNLRPDDDTEKEPIVLYDDESYPGYCGVPIDWGYKTYCQQRGVEIIDRTVLGQELNAPRRPDPNHPSVLNPEAQQKFMDDMLAAVRDDFTVTAEAATGSGKTVVGLNTAAELNRSTLVVCHLERIAKQWLDGAHDHLGVDKNDITFIRGPKCDFTKPFAVTLVQSLSSREYPPEFYHAYGTVIWDELHKYGTPRYASSFFMFPSAYKITLSATLERKDRADAAYFKQFGRAKVTFTSEALPCEVTVLPYTTSRAVWGDDMETLKLCVSKDPARNELIAGIIRMLYNRNRTVLAIGDSIEHIEYIIGLLVSYGVPKNMIGQHTGEFTNPKTGEREKTLPSYLDWCKITPRVIFGTYGMLKEGVDIPRLDAGIDITPIGSATQVLGRIRRLQPGKAKPLWYTLLDKRVGPFYGLYKGRMKDYRNDVNIEVISDGKD